MKPYKAYKETGIDWLPRIPAHWKTERLKHCLSTSLQYGANASGIEYDEHLPRYIRITDILTPSELREDGKVSLPHHEAAPYILKNKDVLFARSGATAGKAFLYKTSTGDAAYAGYLIRAMTNPERLLPEFLLLVTQSVYYKEWTQSIFIQATIPNISAERYANLLLALPPLMEQHHIVLYLEALIAKIDQYITTKQKEISVLEEYKQTIINEAVTKGLDRTVPMKDSGIEWIGEIPAHWEVSTVRHFYISILGKMLQNSSKSSTDTVEKYLCAKDIHFGNVDKSNLKSMWFSEADKKMYHVLDGDLLIVEGGAGAGGCSIYHGNDNIFVQNSVHVVRPKSDMTNTFLCYWLEYLVKRGYIDYACNKATIPHFTKDKLLDTPIVILPINEQYKIITYINERIQKIIAVIATIQKQIASLNEYRTTLISDVVTGQVNVCESQ